MKSVIINMVERMKDTEDRKLESLFASDAIPDAGFSVRIEKRIRRQLWVRRLALPIAVVIGGAIAVKPLAGLVTSLMNFMSVLPANVSTNLSGVSALNLPQMSTIALGSMLVVAVITIARLFEE